MAHPSPRTRRPPALDSLERRQVPAALGLAPAAVALYSSPLATAAGAAATAYQAGQLAYTGHTTFLLDAVRVDQPFALKDLRGQKPAAHGGAPRPPSRPAPVPGVRLQVPPLLARLKHPDPPAHKPTPTPQRAAKPGRG